MRMQGSGAEVPVTVANNVRSATVRRGGVRNLVLRARSPESCERLVSVSWLGARSSLHSSTTNQSDQHGRGRIQILLPYR